MHQHGGMICFKRKGTTKDKGKTQIKQDFRERGKTTIRAEIENMDLHSAKWSKRIHAEPK
jgi:nicotinic acid mononucleotide adenylyltransferase